MKFVFKDACTPDLLAEAARERSVTLAPSAALSAQMSLKQDSMNMFYEEQDDEQQDAERAHAAAEEHVRVKKIAHGKLEAALCALDHGVHGGLMSDEL